MSSANKKLIKNSEAVPVIYSDLFDGKNDYQIALITHSPEDILSYKKDTVEEAALKLRWNVYGKKTAMLKNSVMRIDGTEIDEYDERSVHFTIAENRSMGKIAIFSCARMILKDNEHRSDLPIEDFYPEAFQGPTNLGDFEISRFIECHDDTKTAYFAKLLLMAAGLSYSEKNNLGSMYGVVEPVFARLLKIMGIPMDQITDVKVLDDYNDKNVGIKIDKIGAKKTVESKLGEIAMKKIFTSDENIVFLNS